MRGAGRAVFAAILLMIVGTINIIYGIGALDDANVFVNDTRFILTNLNTLGWVLIILGVLQLTGGFSLMAGNTYGRVIGIIAGSLGALGALLSIGGNNPWWSLCVFALCVYVVYGLSSSAKTRGQRQESEAEWTGARCRGLPPPPRATTPIARRGFEPLHPRRAAFLGELLVGERTSSITQVREPAASRARLA